MGSVAVLGAGALGAPVARRLAATGSSVSAWDHRADQLAPLLDAGVRTVEDLFGLIPTDVLVVLLPDDDAVSNVLVADGLLGRLTPGTTVLLMSTVSPDLARDLATRAETAGLQLLECPVSGGPDAAAEGELTLLVGGDDEAVGAAGAVLDALGSTVIRTGPVGSAAVVKLCHQVALFTTLAGAHEAIALAAEHGISEDVVIGALEAGAARSWVSCGWGFYDRLARRYDDQETPAEHRPWVKDLKLAGRLAERVALALPVTAAVAGVLPDLVDQHARAAAPVTEGGER